MKTFWKRFRKYIITLVIIALVVMFAWPKPVKIEFITEPVIRGDVTSIVSVTGSVESESKIELHFQKPGKIKSLNVAVGDKVEPNIILASLDTKTLEIQVAQAAAGVDLARANLNLRLAGPSRQDIAVTQKDVDSAKVAYQASLSSLEATKNSLVENEKKSRLLLSNARVARYNAAVQYENAKTTGSSTTDTSAQALANAYENARNAVSLGFITAKAILPYADSILGVDQIYNNDAFQLYLGTLDAQSKIDAENYYLQAKASLQEAETAYNSIVTSWQPAEVDLFLPKMQTMLRQMKQLTRGVYDLLLNSTPGGVFTSAMLEGFKTTATSQDTSVTNNINTLEQASQAIANAKLGLSSTGTTTSAAEDNAKAALDTASNNLSSAESGLSQTQVENNKTLTLAEADVDLKKVSWERAQAAYAAKVADPRAVDVASLRAQVVQAQAGLELAQQNVKDAQIIAPVGGMVTEVNGEVGENVSGAEITVVMITPQLTVKANVSETDITKVKQGDVVKMTLDAFSPDVVFEGSVGQIDPAETVVQGVIYYQITTVFNIQNPEVKAGMTANLDILSAEKKDVLSISPQAVQYENNKPFVKILVNETSVQKEVTLGLEGNERIEVISGVMEGDLVILLEKNGK